ncbi:UBX domain-containing protein 10 [Python bivittatus]|uniref:UBX domain-containing protein 10 n=1 Tax=Python bivittatus TaxID=176946 RepID=A0A9F5MQ13_PYTBI|nr:UBX domain-containing protein 10 [Python bivittatus]XP_025019101.1 UBX domain-containing protein 10 [Python bivittatus]
MAAASPLTISPSERKVPFGIVKSPIWPPHCVAMHVTRPKSAKGRTRSNLSYSQSVGAYSYPVPSSPQPVTPGEEAVSSRRAASSQQLFQPVQVFPAEVPDLLQQVPARTSSSLNKYRVLPSISRKDRRMGAAGAMSEQASQLPAGAQEEEEEEEEEEQESQDPSLLGKGPTPLMEEHKGGGGEYAQAPFSPLERPQLNKRREGGSPTLALNLEEPCEKEPRLLLAIRSPSGERFERYFRPTDNLGTVVAAAEQKNEAAYRRCSIGTVEVPRRTFSDLTKSLQDCAICHKSVLCILLEEQEGEL